MVRGPVFCPVSGFCTSDDRIKKFLCRQISFDILVDLHIDFSRSGVRFSVQFPVFVSDGIKIFLYRKISFVLLNSFYARSQF